MWKPITSLSLLFTGAVLISGCATWHAGRADKAHERMAYAKAADQYDKALRSADDPKTAAHLRDEMLRAAEAHQRKHEMKEAATLYGRRSSRWVIARTPSYSS